MITIKGKPISQKTIFIVVLSALGVLLVGLCIGLVVALTPKDKAVVAPSSSQTEEIQRANLEDMERMGATIMDTGDFAHYGPDSVPDLAAAIRTEILGGPEEGPPLPR